jgi:hypothetical protein
MALIPQQSKPINFSPITITESSIIQPNVYNTIYVQSLAGIIITLPNLSGPILDGFPYLIKNFSAFTTTINNSAGGLITNLLAGSSIILIVDKENNEWRDFLGPIGGSAGSPVNGPGTSVNNAIVTWNGTSGSLLASSSPIIADASGNLSSILTLSAVNGNFTTQLLVPNAIEFQTGSGILELAATPIGSGTIILTLPGAADTLVARATTDTLTNKNLLSSTNTISARYLWTNGAGMVEIDLSTPSLGQVLTATSASAATWQTLPAGISGPGSSIINALAIWTNSGGTALGNSVAILDNTGNLSGINNLTATGNISGVSEQLTGNLVFSSGVSATTITTVPSGTHSITIPTPTSAGDSFVLASVASTLLNKTITDSSNIVYASGFITTGASVVTSGAAPPSTGQVLTATSATTAAWQSPSTVTGPGSSTNDAIAVWNGTSGNSLLNTVVTLNPVTGLISGVGQIVYGSGANTTALANTPSGNNTMTLPTVSGGDTLVARTSTDTLTNKTYVYTVDGNVSATGTSQGTAYAITKYFTFITSSTPSGNGVILPVSQIGSSFVVKVVGSTASSGNVYPPSGQFIDTMANNAPYVISVGSSASFMYVNTNIWQSFT